MRLTRHGLAAGIGALVTTTALTVALVVQNQDGDGGGDGRAGNGSAVGSAGNGRTTGAAAAGTADAVSSKPTSAPVFLSVDELPPYPHSPWHADDPTVGPPDHLGCLGDVTLPADGTWHRRYRTELDTEASQVVVRATDPVTAEQLTEDLKASAAACAADWLRGEPGSMAGWDDHGPLDVGAPGDSAHLYSVHIAPPQAGMGISGIGIGRAGTTVTLVNWSQMGTLPDVPVAELTETMGHALGHLAD